MIRAVLSIGSNMDDRLALLRTVPAAIRASGDIELLAASSIYSTAPWGVEDQDEFLNATLIVETTRSPEELLAFGQGLEADAERVRVRRWGPRTLDVDVVQVIRDGAEVRSDDPVLTLPHPHAYHRAFVLVPWLEIEPDAELAGRAVREWVGELEAAEIDGVHRRGALEENGAAGPDGGEHP